MSKSITYYVFINQKEQNSTFLSKVLMSAFSKTENKVVKEKITTNKDNNEFHTITFLESVFKNIGNIIILVKDKNFYQKLIKQYPNYKIKYSPKHQNWDKIKIELNNDLNLPKSLLETNQVDLKNKKTLFASHMKNLLIFLKASIYFQNNMDKIQEIPLFKYYKDSGFIPQEQIFEDFLMEVADSFSQIKNI